MKNNTLKGKTAFITGGAKRIGREIALTLAQKGVHIVIQYNNSLEAHVKNVINDVSKYNVKAWKIKCDFSKVKETKKVFTKIKNQIGKVDILINSASSFKRSDIRKVSPEKI